MDDERLKRGTYLTEKYFDEQLERIPCSIPPILYTDFSILI
mgnify:FL=1